MANDVPESMGQVNENENRSKISISAESRDEPTNYLADFQQAEILKRQLASIPGVHILECLEINSVLNGWWILTHNVTDKK